MNAIVNFHCRPFRLFFGFLCLIALCKGEPKGSRFSDPIGGTVLKSADDYFEIRNLPKGSRLAKEINSAEGYVRYSFFSESGQLFLDVYVTDFSHANSLNISDTGYSIAGIPSLRESVNDDGFGSNPVYRFSFEHIAFGKRYTATVKREEEAWFLRAWHFSKGSDK